MTKARTVKKRAAKPDYHRNEAGCLVYTIECAVQHDVSLNDADSIQAALDNLSSVGAAEIVQVDHVSESWDDACKILRRRAVR